VMVKDSGSVPLSTKGAVVGLGVKTLDVVWDVSFMSGSTLGEKCSQPRGATVDLDSCLNLSNCQLLTSTNPSELQGLHPNVGPHHGPVQWPPPQSVWRSPANRRPVNLVANSHRGGLVGGHGSGTPAVGQATASSSNHWRNGPAEPQTPGDSNIWNSRGRGGPRGFGPRGGGNPRGRGFIRGIPPIRGGGTRGRGRGQGNPWTIL